MMEHQADTLDSLYERDLLLWSETQADLLARLAAGERVNEQIDWNNLIEEVRDLGLSELKACRSWLELACFHLLKISALPEERVAGHWEREVVNFVTKVRQHYVASMGSKIDLDKHYASALRQVRKLGWASAEVPEVCPFKLEDFLSDDVTVADLLAKLGRPA